MPETEGDRRTADQPGQAWQDLVATGGTPPEGRPAVPPPPPPARATPMPRPAAAPPKPRTNLQLLFDQMTAAKPPAPKSFWCGGGQKPPEDENLVIKVVQLILDEAVRARASDIHVEPMEDVTRLRLRVDGMLEEVLLIPRTVPIRTTSRIRVMAGLDPEQSVATAKPQDGRMTTTVDGRDVDIRLSTFPTSYGDKIVLRLIERGTKVSDLSEIGLKPAAVEAITRLIHRPQGMIIVTGPAGNGKSTTLYTVLQSLNTAQRNIVTLEDPIELKIRGITQSAIQPKIGFTFAEGLRSILRQDPNVVMVGEIRDLETAEIALSASLTGHLLFTTLHTNSALGAVTRLVDMGLEPYLIASALTALFAQRLARRMCASCREAYATTPDLLDKLRQIVGRAGVAFPVESIKQLYRSKGCDACRGSGYAGRTLLFEMTTLSPVLRQLILQKASLLELQAAALKEGMEPLLVDGLQKAAQGVTSLAEVVRVVGVAD